ncbi:MULTISPECIES: hypothetical protein [Syntrophotalea]|uniref:Uncharacterized protein n=1 Tax=Syntrophotalea acetylenica TaxID=29542 RepID=A0A1L3GGU5_SYNAC|nr:hypothetical protein [Syntrophotalea acetylenica]APG25110.1 hypothetical protein A7E75_08825 [Syntrophotalea acetylenica]APG43179.1 hypothetical protein A6070_02800 [Syntrophotalea acetylenica]
MNKLILLLLAAGLGYAAYTNPDINDHREAISGQWPEQAFYTDEQQEERFGDLDYTNFIVGSATKDTVKMTMVSYGFLGRVTVVDEEWQTRPVHD